MRVNKLSAALAFLATVLIVIYYWKFTHVSLRTGHGHDDLMNLFFAWREPFADVVKANFFFRTNVTRPFGALFYTVFFEWYGLDGFPYRVFCYVVLWCNLGLTYFFVRRATDSREIGLLSTLLHCYQANYFPMYYGSGYCYDVFAFFFYYAAFNIALWFRRPLGFWPCAAMAALFACAVNSKESAASLPALLLLYCLLFHTPRSWSGIWREARPVLVTGCVGLVFLWARFTGPNNLLNHPAYAPVFTLQRYLESIAACLNELSSHSHLWTPERAGILLAAMGGVALSCRSRILCFAWLMVIVGAAPIAFVPPRGLAAHYIPLLGYAIFASTLLVRTRHLLTQILVQKRIEIVSQAALFALVFAISWRWQIQTQRRVPEHWQQMDLMRQTEAQFRRHPEWFRPGASLLIVNDPFTGYEWASSFLALLVSREKSLQVHTMVKLDPKPTRQQIDAYSKVIAWRNGSFMEVDRQALNHGLGPGSQ